jgi:hypothetical protein
LRLKHYAYGDTPKPPKLPAVCGAGTSTHPVDVGGHRYSSFNPWMIAFMIAEIRIWNARMLIPSRSRLRMHVRFALKELGQHEASTVIGPGLISFGALCRPLQTRTGKS